MRTPRSIAVATTATLLLTACDGDSAEPVDEGPPAEAEEEVDEGPQEAPDEAPEEDLDDEDDLDGEADAGSELSTGGGRATPDDVDLDLAQRHAGGTVLEVTGMQFEGNTVLVDAEFINGATGDVELRIDGGQRLRLVDDLGSDYNFVVPDDLQGESTIELPVGESIGGAFAFLGPVSSDATELWVVVNTFGQDDLDDFQPENQLSGTGTPTFILGGLELSW